jgi:predicted secreted protein
MAIQEEIKMEVGQSVDITLESSVGSTGYGWELATLEGNINLVGIAAYPIASRIGAPVAQVFTFRGTAEGSGKAVFILTAAWKIEEPKETVTYTFNVVKATAAETDAFRLEGFTTTPRAAVRSTVVPPYSIPARLYYGVLPPQAIYSAPIDPCLCATGNEDCCGAQPLYNVRPPVSALYNVRPPVIEYGVRPPQPLYAAPNDPCSCTTGNEECCNPPTVLKYNFPVMRYNIPPMMRYNIPPVMRYNFPSNDGSCC